MAMPASRFVRLPSPHHDRGTVPGSGLSIDEPLIPGRRTAAHDADRLELVHHLGDAHECRHWTERQPPEIDVRPRQNDAHTPVGETVRQVDKDRKSTRLNSSHLVISYAVFCLKKKKNQKPYTLHRFTFTLTSFGTRSK